MDDSAAPAFFKRTKSRTLRSRASSPGARPKANADVDEQSGDNDDASDSPGTLVTKLKNKHKARAKPKARLSFGGDEEVSFLHCVLV
jgi:GC-rich sequence DNA-binding factor